MNYTTQLEIFKHLSASSTPEELELHRKELLSLSDEELANFNTLVNLPWPPEVISPADLSTMRGIVVNWKTSPAPEMLTTAVVLAHAVSQQVNWVQEKVNPSKKG